VLRITVGKKLFAALALLLAFSLLLFVGLSRFALQQGIGQYVAEIELSRLDWMVSNLQGIYNRDGSWKSFRSNPAAWHSVQMPAGESRGPSGDRSEGRDGPGGPPQDRLGDRRPGGDGGPPRDIPQLDVLPNRFVPPPPPDWKDDPRARPDLIYNRLALLDVTGKELIAGDARALRSQVRTPIVSQGQTVAYLSLAPLEGIRSEADRAFASRQLFFTAAAGLAGLLFALLISVWLAKRWLTPIDRLIKGAQEVAAGNLAHVVEVRGNDEFAAMTKIFNDMSQKLSSIEESRQRWLSDVAHELRTPVAAMRAEIEAVQDGIRIFDSSTAHRLHGQVMRLGKLVEDLRLVSQDTYAPSQSKTEEVAPLEVLIEVIEIMEARLHQAGLKLEGLEELRGMASGTPCLVQGDPGRLAQVFSNLLENSLRYTDRKGVIRVQAAIEARQPACLLIVFDDSAPQPAETEISRLFDRFYRGEESRARVTGGSGLGLAICRAIITAHEGTIVATASPLGGLRMTLTLPLKP
jgi:two-component system sensor histidine kinase BaeS